MNKFRFLWLPVLLVALALLSACQIGAPTGAATTPSATPSVTPAPAVPSAEPTQPAASTGAFRDASVALAESAYPGPATPIAGAPTAPPATGPDAAADNPYPRDKPIVADDEYVIPGLALGSVQEVFRATTALDYPALTVPNPARQPVFPDVPVEGRPALVAYEAPFEDGDYFEHRVGDIDVPQYYYRVMTAGEVKIAQLGVHCIATDKKGCLVVVINHFGPTSMFRDDIVDNGFTVAGRVWDMGTPAKVTLAGQALLDHYAGRMTASPDGANCATIEACGDVEWHLVVFGNDFAMWHVAGLYNRSVDSFNFNAPVGSDAPNIPNPAVHLPAGQQGAQVLATPHPAAAKPAPAPTAPPVVLAEPTAAPAAAPAEAAVESHELTAGETWTVPGPGWACSADLKAISGNDRIALHDEGDGADKTASVVGFYQSVQVFAEWPGYCEKSSDNPVASGDKLAAQITDGRQVLREYWPRGK